MFLKEREREITFSAREEGEECIRKESIDCARAFRHSRERERDASNVRKSLRGGLPNRDREKPFLKKTYRARFASSSSSSERWRRWFRDDDARCRCCCYSSASRENSSALLLLAEFRWSLCVSQERKNKAPRRMLTRLSCEKTRETRRAREGFFLFVRPTFRDGSCWCRPEV